MRFIDPSYEILACPSGDELLSLLEKAARVCYKSEDKIHSGERCDSCADGTTECALCGGTGFSRKPSSHAMVRKLLKSGHLSVIEHQSITVRFVCNRGVSHELVRHRLCSFSQESTRYCNYGKGDAGLNIIEPSYRRKTGPDEHLSIEYERRKVWEKALSAIERAYLELLALGEKPQQARDILPIGLKTEIVTTCNLREWKHIFNLRCSKKAHPQIRELMIPLREELRLRIPLIFDPPREPHKYDKQMLKALLNQGVVTKEDLQAALDAL